MSENPFDTLNSSNNKKSKNLKSTSPQKVNKVSKKSGGVKNGHQSKKTKKHLRLSGYSTVRISADHVISLKALQLITKDKNRDDLIDRALKILYPVLLNSPSKRKKFHQLRDFAIKEVELKRKMMK